MTAAPPAAPDEEIPPPFIDQLRRRATHVPAMVALVAANLAVFAAMLVAGAGVWHAPNTVQLEWGANFGPATKDGEWWRLATAMFLHFGLLHLMVNMLALVEAGRFVERCLGSARFLLLYLGSGLAGNLLSLVMQGDRGISGGASGAVFGVYAALLLTLWLERHALAKTEFRWLFWGGMAFTACNIALGLFIRGIDNGAHVGGFVFGLLAAVALARSSLLSAWLRAGAATLITAGITLLVAAIPAPAYDWSDELDAREEIRQFIGTDANISDHWNTLLEQGRREGLSFEELATRIDSEVADRYEASFEQLATMHLDPRAPSVPAIEQLKRYAETRRAASHEFADALRAGDPGRIRQAIDKAKSARLIRKDHSGPVSGD
ncbi:MAG: rhomboid family intramembrane serine protease [Pseudomonadota bacterium]